MQDAPHSRIFLSILICTSTARADGITLKLEGGRGVIDFADTGIFHLEKQAPPPDVFFTDLDHGMHRGPVSSYDRGEADFDLGLPSGQTLRLGGIWSELQGSHREETPV